MDANDARRESMADEGKDDNMTRQRTESHVLYAHRHCLDSYRRAVQQEIKRDWLLVISG